MRVTPVHVLEELLRMRESAISATAWFKTRKHNDDLCPLGEEQVNAVMECFVKFFVLGYDIQGPKDQGTDIVLRYLPSGDSEHQYVALQLKSYDDLKHKDYLRILKAQESDSRGRFRDQLERYYIVLCTDAKEHREKIREIKNAFATAEQVSVINPTFARTFFALTRGQIFSAVQAEVRSGDIVFRQATAIAADLTPTEFATLLLLTKVGINTPDSISSLERLHSDSFLQHVYNSIPVYNTRDSYFGEDEVIVRSDLAQDESAGRFAEDIDKLTGLYVQSYANNRWELDIQGLKPLSLLLLDAELRFNMKGNELLEHVYDLLKPDWPLSEPKSRKN